MFRQDLRILLENRRLYIAVTASFAVLGNCIIGAILWEPFFFEPLLLLGLFGGGLAVGWGLFEYRETLRQRKKEQDNNVIEE